MKTMKLRLTLKEKIQKIKRDLAAVYLAYKHPATPLYAKLVAIVVVGYALSPIDLIPDFIPLLGYLDDIILIPLGITLAIRLIPKDVMAECREKSADIFKDGKPKNWIAGGIIISIWIIIVGIILTKIWKTKYINLLMRY